MDVTPGLRRDPAPDLEAVGQDERTSSGGSATRSAATGRSTFARFMELALYDPDGGYYRGGDARPGRMATS